MIYQKEIDTINLIPGISEVIVKLLEVIDDYEVNDNVIANLMLLDQSIVAKVLSIANSVSYAGKNYITDVKRAINRIGRRELKNIIITINIAETLKKLETVNIDRHMVWHHSLATAFIAKRLISNYYNNGTKELENIIYLTGLMHDIGYLIFDFVNPEKFKEVCDIAVKNNTSFYKIEQKIMGTNHCLEAGKVFENWNLPKEVVEGIVNHHSKNVDNFISNTVSLADHIARRIGYKIINELDCEEIDKLFLKNFRMDINSDTEMDLIFREFLENSILFISFAEMSVI